MATDVGHYVGQQPDGLERHAGEGIERGAAVLAQPVEGHAGRSAQLVGNHGAGLRHEGLGTVDVEHGNAAGAENPLDDGQLLVRLLVAGRAGKLAERVFGDVVLRGAEAAGDDDDVGVVQAVAELLDDPGAVVADGRHIFDLNAEQVEFAGNMG